MVNPRASPRDRFDAAGCLCSTDRIIRADVSAAKECSHLEFVDHVASAASTQGAVRHLKEPTRAIMSTCIRDGGVTCSPCSSISPQDNSPGTEPQTAVGCKSRPTTTVGQSSPANSGGNEGLRPSGRPRRVCLWGAPRRSRRAS